MSYPLKPVADIVASAFVPKVVISVDYNDVDELINSYFNSKERKYECVAYEEWGNSESHDFELKKEKLDAHDKKLIEKAKQGKFEHFSTRVYLQHLVNEGILPEGEYLIEIFW